MGMSSREFRIAATGGPANQRFCECSVRETGSKLGGLSVGQIVRPSNRGCYVPGQAPAGFDFADDVIPAQVAALRRSELPVRIGTRGLAAAHTRCHELTRGRLSDCGLAYGTEVFPV